MPGANKRVLARQTKLLRLARLHEQSKIATNLLLVLVATTAFVHVVAVLVDYIVVDDCHDHHSEMMLMLMNNVVVVVIKCAMASPRIVVVGDDCVVVGVAAVWNDACNIKLFLKMMMMAFDSIVEKMKLL